MNSTDDELNDDSGMTLSEEFAIAVARARALTASPETVARVAAFVLERTVAQQPMSHTRSTRTSRVGWSVLVAGSVVVAVQLISAFWTLPATQPHDSREVLSHNMPAYSEVTRTPLILVAFRPIEHELDRADAVAAQLSRSIAREELRRDIRETLEEFRNWSE